MTRDQTLPPLAVSIGEPAGIGPDVIVAAQSAAVAGNKPLPAHFIIGDDDLLRQRAKLIGLTVEVKPISSPGEFDSSLTALQVLSCGAAMKSTPGQPAPGDGAAVIGAIDKAVELIFAGQASGMVTAPINKEILYQHGFTHPGHTEYLAHLAQKHTGQSVTPVMMIAGRQLRTIPVTIHIPLMAVAEHLSTELIVETATIAAQDLTRSFGIERPRLAISGLNPHAGENGTMGREDLDVVLPAVQALQQAGIDATGPLPADTMFHAAARQTYDVAICMYHDQALIPAKTLGFDDAVNVTLGLPFVRTSPDHGTAFAIAGSGKASPQSYVEALNMAWMMAQNRKAASQ